MIKQVAVLSLLLLGACSIGRTTRVIGSGVPSIHTRALTSFTAIEFAGSIDASVIVGSASEVVIDGDANLHEYLITEIDGDTLEVYVKRGFSLDPMPSITVYIPSLESLGLAGSGDITATGADSEELALSIEGSGTMRVDGFCESLDISIAGSGDVHCFALDAARVAISIAGSADVEVHAREALVVDIAGRGDVRYKGEPSVEQNVAGAGDIRRATN